MMAMTMIQPIRTSAICFQGLRVLACQFKLGAPWQVRFFGVL